MNVGTKFQSIIHPVSEKIKEQQYLEALEEKHQNHQSQVLSSGGHEYMYCHGD